MLIKAIKLTSIRVNFKQFDIRLNLISFLEAI
jgi:hypothetical protein